MKPPPSYVVWRGGVAIQGTPLACDAPVRRAAGVCFVSSAAIAGAWRHRQILATEATLRLLPRAAAARPQVRALAVPTGRPFGLGNARVELFPSGAGLGAASVVVTVDAEGTRVCYAGAVDVAADRLGGAAELRPCDELVIDARYGDPRHVFPPRAEVLDDLRRWVAGVRAAGGTPVLLAEPLAGALELARAFAEPLAAHPQIRSLAHKARTLVSLPELARGKPRSGEILVWPLGLAPPPGARVARVTGAALGEPDGFPLAEQAGHADLLRYVEQSGARRVHLLGPAGPAGALAAVLVRRGIAARPLAAPEQLTLVG